MWRPTLRRSVGLALLVLVAIVPGTGAAPTLAEDPAVPYRLPIDGPTAVLREFDPPAHEWSAGHRGVDLALPPGGPVLAPAAGVITFAGQVAGRPVITVAHADGRRSSLEPVVPAVAVGEVVTAGQVIGALGQPGASHCAPIACLHWGVREGRTYVDPLGLLDAPGPVVLLADGRRATPSA
ncbi:MAG: M23 family metallopeptidase [Actinobacteria bacterium]|nr:M23 family metallopeptidase [Actinomycetota bacterium]MCG2803048.1 M23 family metallopeptidase [Cellulomonas sp.]